MYTGLVNCVYYNPDNEQFWLIDYRLFSPETDGKSKLDHVLDMLQLVKTREISFKNVLMDSWYATTEIFKYLIGETFYSDADVWQGKTIQLFRMPLATYFKLFRVLVSTTRTDYIITHDLTQNNTEAAEKESSIRWKVEQLHREEKQITGRENGQCRLARSQRNHIVVANLVWLTFKRLAYKTNNTLYQLKHQLLDDYLLLPLKHPSIAFA